MQQLPSSNPKGSHRGRWSKTKWGLLLFPFTRASLPNLSFMPARPQGADYHHASQILLTPLLTYSDRMDRIYSNSQSSRLELAEFAPIPWSMCS